MKNNPFDNYRNTFYIKYPYNKKYPTIHIPLTQTMLPSQNE